MTERMQEPIEQDRAEVEARLSEMQTELVDREARENAVVWGESESGLARRRGQAQAGAPPAHQGGRVRLLELDRKGEEERAAALEERRAEAYGRVEEARAAKAKADEEHGRAVSDWTDAHRRLDNRRRRIKEIGREIEALRGEGL